MFYIKAYRTKITTLLKTKPKVVSELPNMDTLGILVGRRIIHLVQYNSDIETVPFRITYEQLSFLKELKDIFDYLLTLITTYYHFINSIWHVFFIIKTLLLKLFLVVRTLGSPACYLSLSRWRWVGLNISEHRWLASRLASNNPQE